VSTELLVINYDIEGEKEKTYFFTMQGSAIDFLIRAYSHLAIG